MGLKSLIWLVLITDLRPPEKMSRTAALYRFAVKRCGFGEKPSTVRVADVAAGELADLGVEMLAGDEQDAETPPPGQLPVTG